MKSLPRSKDVFESLEAVRLYRDDLERIVGLLHDAGLDTTIADRSFQYESFDELQKTQGSSPRQLQIEATKINTTPLSFDRITLSKSGRNLYLSSLGHKYYGLAREIEALVRARQSPVAHLPLFWMFLGSVLLLLIGQAIRASYAPASFTLIAIGAAAFVCTLGLSVHWFVYPKIVLNYKHEAGFLARNRDAILLLLCGTVIGAIVQYLVSLFVRTSAPKGAP